MLETFGATFFGVIGSFLLWYGGQWWLKRRKDQITVKHIEREIHEEIVWNINILARLVHDVTNAMTGEDVPVFIPHRMKVSVHCYLISSGELRLVDVSQQRWILNAGMISEGFNKFIDNTELLLTLAIGQPNSVVVASHRLTGLVNSAQETAKSLKEVLVEIENPPTKIE